MAGENQRNKRVWNVIELPLNESVFILNDFAKEFNLVADLFAGHARSLWMMIAATSRRFTDTSHRVDRRTAPQSGLMRQSTGWTTCASRQRNGDTGHLLRVEQRQNDHHWKLWCVQSTIVVEIKIKTAKVLCTYNSTTQLAKGPRCTFSNSFYVFILSFFLFCDGISFTFPNDFTASL